MMEVSAIANPVVRPDVDPLVQRARAGDFEAFERLYHRHVGRVFAVCLRLVGDRGRAEELSQETFVRAWQGLAGFRGASGFGAWLRRVAVNVVLADQRARRRRRWREHPLGAEPAAEPAAAEAEDPSSALALERAIGQLPERARRVFVLHDVEGYRHDEVAALLGVTVGTSKAQLHRARRLLREALRR